MLLIMMMVSTLSPWTLLLAIFMFSNMLLDLPHYSLDFNATLHLNSVCMQHLANVERCFLSYP